MPKEETIELRHLRGVVGEKTDLASLNTRSSLSSIIRAIITKFYGVPQLIHLYGALGLNKTLTLNAGENLILTIFSDGTFLYAGLASSPGKVVKVDLSTFTEVSTLTFAAGETQANSLFSDGTFLYAATSDSPGKIVKINLSTFTKVGTLTFSDINASNTTSLFSDGTFLYAGIPSISGKVVKIDLSTFTEVSTLTLAGGENQVNSLFSDGTFLYAALDTSPGKIIKIKLSSFTEISTLTLNTGENGAKTLFSDGTYLYTGLNISPGKIVKIDLSTFTEVSTLTLATGENQINSLFSDGIYLYIGTATIPGLIIKVDLSTFTEVSASTLAVNENTTKSLFSDGTYLYAGLLTSPGKIIRQYIIPSSDLHQRKIDLINEQVHSGNYSIIPSNAAGITITSGAGAYTKGNYTEIIPVNTVLTQYFVTGLIVYNLTVNTDYEYDIATGLAGSEVIVATVSHMAENTNREDELQFTIPIKISSDTRISIRSSDGTGSLTSKVKLRYKI